MEKLSNTELRRNMESTVTLYQWILSFDDNRLFNIVRTMALDMTKTGMDANIILPTLKELLAKRTIKTFNIPK